MNEPFAPADPSAPVSRRALLGGAMLVAGAAAVPALGGRDDRSGREFHGRHQPGITDRPLPFVAIGGFDSLAADQGGLRDLMQSWTAAAQRAGRTTSGVTTTVTVGFGPSLFDRPNLELDSQRPVGLHPLPAFDGDALDPATSGGDLCVVACASSPTAATGALRELVNAGRGSALLRWRQTGYRAEDGTADPRGAFGFRDGTANPDPSDPDVARDLWVQDGPAWLRDGTYLVVRRIRLLLDTWDRTPPAVQQRLVGRDRTTNERDSAATDSHAALASPQRNGGARLLRRSYTYDAGVDVNGLQDSGMIFMSYQRDAATQFVPIQRRLAAADPLNSFSQHVASGLFACPPGCLPGSWLASELLA